VTLGRWPAIAVKDARDIARDLAARVARGEDPALDRKREAGGDGDRFETVAKAFIDRVVRPRQLRTAHQTATLIENRLVRAWRGRRISEITRGDVVRLLDAEIDAGRGRTANKLLAVTKRLFDWAAERHDLDRNPASGLSRPAVERSRERVLGDDELAVVWKAAERLAWPWGPYVQLLILSGQRRREAAELRWSEIDLEAAVWRLPAERSKSNRSHVIPLSEPALEILRAAPRLAGDDHVFWTHRGAGLSGFAQSKAKLDRIILQSGAELAPWSLHDLRRSCATGMAQLGVEPHVLAAVLNHAPASVQGVTASTTGSPTGRRSGPRSTCGRSTSRRSPRAGGRRWCHSGREPMIKLDDAFILLGEALELLAWGGAERQHDDGTWAKAWLATRGEMALGDEVEKMWQRWDKAVGELRDAALRKEIVGLGQKYGYGELVEIAPGA
jgi:integrase